MHYSTLADACSKLESTTKKLEKAEIVAKLLRETPSKLLPRIVLLLGGSVFPAWDERKIGISTQLMIKAIARATGRSEKEVVHEFKNSGDLGASVEKLIGGKKQRSLHSKALTVDIVFENLEKITAQEGSGSQDRKLNLIAELFISASPLEARYVARTVIGDLRVGVAEGIMRDAIAKAFLYSGDDPKEKKKFAKIVENAWFLNQDYGQVAKIAKEGGIAGLKKARIEIGQPVSVSLAEKSPDLKTAVESYKNYVLETKYDGMRAQIHKNGEKFWIFTRRLENVAKQFPDLVKLCKEEIKAKNCIIEGEVLAIDKKTGRPMPFQSLSQRIKRKYGIEEMVKEVPVHIKLFDALLVDGKTLLNEPYKKRIESLKNIFKNQKPEFELSKRLVAPDLKDAEKFYNEALESGQEGVMVKNLDAPYQSGRRVGFMLKVKPVMETLDLAIIGGTWGTGKRAGWVGSLVLGCRKGDEFLGCGMLGSGLKEKKADKSDVTLDELTELLKPLIISEQGHELKFKPKIIIEVAYEEIQKSPTYESGYALRFPRIVRIRWDKKEADGLDRIEKLAEMQKGGK